MNSLETMTLKETGRDSGSSRGIEDYILAYSRLKDRTFNKFLTTSLRELATVLHSQKKGIVLSAPMVPKHTNDAGTGSITSVQCTYN